MGHHPRRLVGALLTSALLFAACGGDDGDDEAAPDDTEPTEELTPVTVATIPVAGFVPLYWGEDQGYFEEEGLDVTLEVGPGGAALIPSVVAGDFDFATSNYVSIMAARIGGADVEVASHIASGASEPGVGTTGLLVRADSGIESVEDLEGKSIATTNLNNIAEVTIKKILEDNGLDLESVTFQEFPPDAMNGAVESGEVDAAFQAEPGVVIGEQTGLVNLLDPMYEAEPGLPLAGFIAASDWLEENAEVAAAFVRAMHRSYEELMSDEELFRQAIEAFTETRPQFIPDMKLGTWEPEVDMGQLALLGELAHRYGVLEEEPDVDTMIWEGASG